MSKFYVNTLGELPPGANRCPGYNRGSIVGLFRKCKASFDSRDPYGAYGPDAFVNTVLYAYFYSDTYYNVGERSSKVTVLNPPVHYEWIRISNHSGTMVIEANSIEDAIRLFANGSWRSISSVDRKNVVVESISFSKKYRGLNPSSYKFAASYKPINHADYIVLNQSDVTKIEEEKLAAKKEHMRLAAIKTAEEEKRVKKELEEARKRKVEEKRLECERAARYKPDPRAME